MSFQKRNELDLPPGSHRIRIFEFILVTEKAQRNLIGPLARLVLVMYLFIMVL